MGQQEVYNFLKKNKRKWYSAREISKKLRLSSGSVTTCLMKLRKSGLINYKFGQNKDIKRKIYIYNFKK